MKHRTATSLKIDKAPFNYSFFYFLFFILVLCGPLAFSQTSKDTAKLNTVSIHHPFAPNDSLVSRSTKLELPVFKQTDTVTYHSAFSLLYSVYYKQALWVAYELTAEETSKAVERADKFKPDPLLPYCAGNADYSKSGFDRGHLAPAADMAWSQVSMKESFYYSNVSPQAPAFNRGLWKKLEEQVRAWAVAYDTVWVVTGPLLTAGLNCIGPNKVAVPHYFYKVILCRSAGNIRGIAFLMPNSTISGSLKTYASTIDAVEKATGLDFFPLLADDKESEVEKTLCLKCWMWQ